MSQVYKVTFTITVLTEADSEGEARARYEDLSLTGIDDAMSYGDDIGQTVLTSVELVPPERVEEELLAIGNDGTFFQPDDEPEQG